MPVELRVNGDIVIAAADCAHRRGSGGSTTSVTLDTGFIRKGYNAITIAIPHAVCGAAPADVDVSVSFVALAQRRQLAGNATPRLPLNYNCHL